MTDYQLEFGIPRGPQGPQGPVGPSGARGAQGPAPVFGLPNTGDPGTQVTMAGTGTAADPYVLTIPKGESGSGIEPSVVFSDDSQSVFGLTADAGLTVPYSVNRLSVAPRTVQVTGEVTVTSACIYRSMPSTSFEMIGESNDQLYIDTPVGKPVIHDATVDADVSVNMETLLWNGVKICNAPVGHGSGSVNVAGPADPDVSSVQAKTSTVVYKGRLYKNSPVLPLADTTAQVTLSNVTLNEEVVMDLTFGVRHYYFNHLQGNGSTLMYVCSFTYNDVRRPTQADAADVVVRGVTVKSGQTVNVPLTGHSVTVNAITSRSGAPTSGVYTYTLPADSRLIFTYVYLKSANLQEP